MDEAGFIVAVNERWRYNARRKGASLAKTCEGANYLAVCDAASHNIREASAVGRAIRDVQAGKLGEFALEYHCHSHDEERWFVVRVTPFPGEFSQYAVIAHEDVTVRVKAERALRFEKDLSDQVIDTVQSIVLLLDTQGRIVRFNRTLEKLSGHTLEDVKGKVWFDLFLPKSDRDDWRARFQRIIQEERVHEYTTAIVTKDGRELEIEWRDVQFRDPDGKVIGLLCSGRDITIRKEAEAALKAREAQLYSFVEQAPAAIAMFDRNMICLAASRQWTNEYCRGYENVVGLHHYEVHPDLPNSWKEIHQRGLAGESLFNDEDHWQMTDGHDVWVRWAVTPWLDVHDTVGGIMIMAEDITRRKKSEESIREQAAEIVAILDAVPMPIFIAHDSDCLHMSSNRAADELLKVPRGSEASLSAPEETKPRHFRPMQEGRELKLEELPAQRAARGILVRDFEFTLSYDNGTTREMLAYATPLLDEVGRPRGAINVLIDITELKRIEESLRDREAHLAAILDTAADAIITIDPHGIIQSVNPATERMFGYDSAEMVGQNVKMLMPNPYRVKHDQYLSRYAETGEAHIIGKGREVVGLRKDRSTFPLELAISEVRERQLYTGLLRDITRRKQLEQEVVEIASLEQRNIGQDLHDTVSQELTALGMMASDLAEILQAKAPEASNLVGLIVAGLKRSQEQIRAVMNGLLPVAIEANGLMTALADLSIQVQQEGKVDCDFDCPEPVLVADHLIATHLYLIAREAVHNATKHGHPTIIHISVENNGYLILIVRDDGSGLSGPSTTNHRGQGLRIMQNRAAIIGATLTIEPTIPSGTCVTCKLPRPSHE